MYSDTSLMAYVVHVVSFKVNAAPGGSVSDNSGMDPVLVKYCLVIAATYKLHPDFLATVADLLVQTDTQLSTPVAVVFIAERGSVEFNEDVILQIQAALQTRMRHVLALTGIERDTAVADAVLRLLARVQFHSYNSYFALLASAAVILDTFPYGGCLTTHDALSHGVPIVSYPQRYVRGRFTLAMYQQMNVSEYTVDSPAEYVNVVLHVLRRTEEEITLARTRILGAFHIQTGGEKPPGSSGHGYLHQNTRVAKEWLGFLVKAWRYQYEV